MGRYCFICHRERPNEAFSGRGHSIGICKKCGSIPKAELQRIKDEGFIHHALEQRNISQKNVEYFKEMRLRYSDELGEKAALMAELGSVHPRRENDMAFCITTSGIFMTGWSGLTLLKNGRQRILKLRKK